MFSSNVDLGQLDLSNVYPTDDLVATALSNRQTNNSIVDNLYFTSSFYLDNSNLSMKEKIALEIFEKNGPVRDELGTALSMTIIYSLILFTGIVGNTATCIVIVKTKYLHTSVNYYLFSLASSDLLLLILGLPQEMYMLWQRYPYIFGEQFCILRAFTSETSTNASILTITAFTIERYLAICHPLKVQTMSQFSRAIKTILIIWAIAAICSIPPAAQLGIVTQTSNTTGEELPQTAQCVIKNPLQNSFEISALCFFFLPMVVILVLYVLIGLELRRSSSISNTNSSASHHHHNSNHLCNQTNTNTATTKHHGSVQRNNNSIVLDNNSSPTTLIYNENKPSVTFYSPANRNRTNSMNSSEQEQIDQQKKLSNYLNIKDKEINSKNLNSPSSAIGTTIKHQQFSSSLKPSLEEQSEFELNNNQLNKNQANNHQKGSTPLFMNNISNGTTLRAHRPMNLMNSTNVNSMSLNPSFNSSTLNPTNLNTLNSSSNHNLNSVPTPTTQSVAISSGNSIHHHRHHQAAASRRSVIKMLVAVVVSFFICWSFFHAQRIMASHIGRDSPEFLILIYRVLTYVSAITYYLTATINPILYQLMSLKFRLAFKETFGCWAPFLRPSQSVHHSSYTAGQHSTINAQTTSLHQQIAGQQIIAYDQPSSNLTTINNVQSSSSVQFTGSQSNLANMKQEPNNNSQSTNDLCRNNTLKDDLYKNSVSNFSSTKIENSESIKEDTEKESIHLNGSLGDSWHDDVEKSKTDNEISKQSVQQQFKNTTLLCNPTSLRMNSSTEASIISDLKQQNNSALDDSIVNNCLYELNGQRNYVNV